MKIIYFTVIGAIIIILQSNFWLRFGVLLKCVKIYCIQKIMALIMLGTTRSDWKWNTWMISVTGVMDIVD